MKITNEFTVHTPIDRAWKVLTDLPGIAPCMPGARLTGVDGDVCQGKVKVKVGPVISEFAGTARFTEKDASAYRAAIDAKGRDARSAGNASALVTAVLKASGDSTVVSVDTDLKISGKLAQFGSGMIKEVSGKLLAQFVTNLEAKLAAEDAGVTTENGDSPATGAAPVASSSEKPASTAATETAAQTAVSPADVSPAPVPSVEEMALAESPVATEELRPGGDAKLEGTEPPAAIRSSASSIRTAPSSATSTSVAAVSEEEGEALDLLAVAGGSIYKRLIPVGVGVVVVGAVIAWLVSRR